MRDEDLYTRGVFASELDDDTSDTSEEDADFDDEDLEDEDDEDYDDDEADGNYNPFEDYQKENWD